MMKTLVTLLSAWLSPSTTPAKRRSTATSALVFSLWIIAPSLARAATFGTLETTYDFHATDLLADPTRPYMYATTGSELEVINTNTLAIVGSLSLPGASGMAMSANGSNLYIGGSNGVYVVNAQTDSLQSTLNLGYSVSQVAAGLNNRLYVLGDDQLTQVDATSGTSTALSFSVLVFSGGIQISPDGTTLYYANYGISPGSLYKINVSTTTPQVTWSNSADIGENGEDLVLSPNGTMVSYVCGYGYQGYQIPNFRTSDMSVLGVFATGAYPDALAYSPDGKYAYALHTPYPTAVTVYSTATYQALGQFNVTDQSSLMAVDASARDLFVSFNAAYDGNTNTAVYATGVTVPSLSVWNVAAGGSWATFGNWNVAGPADGADGTADFSQQALAANASVTLDGSYTIGHLIFGDTAGAHNWTVSAGTGGVLTLQVSRGSPTITVVNQTATLGIVLSGTQGLTKSGSGTLVLNAANTYNGNTLVSGGTLALGNSLALQNSTLDTSGSGVLSFGSLTAATLGGLTGPGTLRLANSSSSALALSVGNNNVSTTFSGMLQGAGSLSKIGSGVLALSGSNAYTGGTTVLGGTLQVGSGGTAGSLTGNIADNAVLVFNRSNNLTFGGVISGTGALTKSGSGALVLGGSNLYTGTTTVSAGTLAIGPSGSINTSSAISIGPAGTLQATATTGGSPLPDTGDLTLGGGMLSYAANGSSSAGESAGTLALNPGQSQVVVSNAGSGTPYLRFAGATAHTTGATVGFSASGSQIEFVSNPPLLANGILPYAFYGPVNSTTVDFATLSTSAGITTVSAVTYSSSTAGNIGSMAPATYGWLNVTASGSQSSLTSPHEFNSLKVVGPASVTMTGTGNLTLASGGLICTGSSATISGGAIWAPTGELIIDTASNLRVASVISTSAALVKTGTATLTLTTTYPIDGNTFINQGTLDYAPTGNLNYVHSISGAGNLLMSGTGTSLILSGTNTYTGGTSVTGGTLVLASDNALEEGTSLTVGWSPP